MLGFIHACIFTNLLQIKCKRLLEDKPAKNITPESLTVKTATERSR